MFGICSISNNMRYTISPFIEEHRERLLPLGLIAALFLAGAFFLGDIWLGWAARSNVCSPPTTSCSLSTSIGYINDVAGSGTTIDTTYLSNKTAVELGSLMELVQTRPSLTLYAQDINKALTPLSPQIVSAVAADETVYALLQKGHATASELDYVNHRIRLALLSQMEQFINGTVLTESGQLEQQLKDIIPDEITSFGLTQLFESRSADYLSAGDIFLIENLQVTGTRGEGNIFDTVSAKMTVQGTQDALMRLIADINDSGDLSAAAKGKALPLMRIVQVNLSAMGNTVPESSVDTPKQILRGEIQLETYIRAVTEESLQPLRQQVSQLREKAKSLQTSGVLKPGVDLAKANQLLDLANNTERALDAATSQKDLRTARVQLQNLTELYQTIIGNYTAS